MGTIKCFDPFRLDVANQSLWQGRTRVLLMPKPFAVLTYLVEHAGRLIPQDELLRAVWPDTHVQRDVLRKHIKEVRRVLGDVAATPRYVETLPKRGYRFVAPVREPPDATTSFARAIAPTLVGREPLLGALNERLQRALHGQRQVVFLMGEAGIGKTSIVEAFQNAVSGIDGVRVVWGQAVEGFGGKEPYYPLLEALARLGRGPDQPLVVDALATCAPTWLVQLPSLVAQERRAALLREVIGATTQRMVRELCEALEAVTQTVALVLVLEDLHWVDHSTLDALSAIARRREPARLLIVGTCRPASIILNDSPFKHLRRELCAHALAEEIVLQPLTVADVGSYIAASFTPNAFPADFETVIHHHSGGNPLFMVATLDHLAQTRVLERDRGCWRMTAPVGRTGPDVPDTLRHTLELQLEHLTDTERRTLLCASVVGEKFSSGDVTAMLGVTGADVDAVCDALARRGQFLRAAGDAAPAGAQRTGLYEFTHALYRDVLYRQLPAATRAAYHRRLAEHLDNTRPVADHVDLPRERAAHYEAAGIYDRAVASLTLAAANALKRYAHSDALALLNHADSLNRQTEDEDVGRRAVQLRQQIGDVQYARGEMAFAADAYEEAAATAIRSQLWPAAAQALMRSARSTAFFDVDRALAACARAEAIALEHGMSALAAEARLVRLCWDLLYRGWSRERSADLAATFQRSSLSPTALLPPDRILYANVQVFRSEYADACSRANLALSQLQATDTLWEHLAAFAAKAGALSLLGRCGEAHRTVTAGIDLARRNDNAPWLDILTGLLASLHLQLCDFAGAHALASERLPHRGDHPTVPSQMNLLVVMGAAQLGLGHIPQAVERFSAARAAATNDLPIVHWYWRLHARLGLVEAALASGRVAAAREDAVRLADAVADLEENMIKAVIWECRARVALADNAPDEAELSIDRALQAVSTTWVPHAAWRVHTTAAAVRDLTDPSRAAAHRERARAAITSIAESLDGYGELKRSFLASPLISSILDGRDTTGHADASRSTVKRFGRRHAGAFTSGE